MAKYRKIDPRIWNDAKFRALSDNGKLVFLFLLTHPHMTSVGAMRSSLAGLAAELDWRQEAFGKAFREASGKGMVRLDESAHFVWLPNFLKYNGPESPNVVKSWVGAIEYLPECELKNELIQQIEEHLKGLQEAFGKAFAEAFPKGSRKTMPNPEQEPEQEPIPPKSPKGDGYTEDFLQFWNAYPNKQKKGDAFKAWKKLKPSQDLVAEILSAVEKAKVSREWQKNNGEFIPHPSSWLNGRRWEDQPVVAPTPIRRVVV